MKIFIISLIFIFSSCTSATENGKDSVVGDVCDIFFKELGPCAYKKITVNISIEIIAADEKLLKTLEVINDDKTHSLQIENEVSMLDGDRGYVSFSDINFDGYPDIAITTTFGLANLYLDYWVYKPRSHKYKYLGNYAKFKLNAKLNTLSNVIKVNAAKYDNNTYLWKGYSLIKK
ncbi:MAG: hypothetical protein QM500_01080 [Methylococcales bacterium]